MASYNKYTESPYSSTGNVDSTSGTPDTRFTSFSPNDARLYRLSANLKAVTTPLKEGQHDPFVTAQIRGEQKLSATALTFQPQPSANGGGPSPGTVVKVTSPIPGTAQHLQQIIANSTPPPRVPEPVEAAKFGVFTIDTGASRCIKVFGIYGQGTISAVNSSFDTIAKSLLGVPSSVRIVPVGDMAFIRVDHIADATLAYNTIKRNHPDLEVDYLQPSRFAHVVTPGSELSDYEGQVHLSARYPMGAVDRKDFEDSLRSLLTVEGPLCAWKRVSSTNAETFELIAEFADAAMAPRAITRCVQDWALGSFSATIALYTPDTSPKQRQTPEATPSRASAGPYSLSNALGRLSIETTQLPQNVATGIGSPGFDVTDAAGPLLIGGGLYSPATISPFDIQQPFMGALNQPSFGLNQLGYLNRSPNPYSASNSQWGYYRNLRPSDESSHRRNLLYNDSPDRRGSAFGDTSPYGVYSPSRDYRAPSRRPPHYARSSQNSATGPHNHVEVQKIQEGLDVRTTIMLRNIPNKICLQELKEIIDLSSHGKYDFIYLRIDFSNECNVGYAFINFADPMDIVHFVNARANQKWHKFKSDKIAEVSYATIQGRDCLIQKFRNSSVMLEPAHYRPKLFYTEHDPHGRAGEEEEFPASDNASKLKRSCENAEHVGLFAPSAGQQMRDDQRRRRSQYDRGTTLALAERGGYDYEDDRNGFYDPSYSHPPPRYL